MLNSIEAKKIYLADFLIKIGATLNKTNGDDIWFFSPLREDGKNPSFKVSKSKNVWHDKALGAGGTIIDLVMHLKNIRDVESALKIIDEIWFDNIEFTPDQKKVMNEIKSGNSKKSVTEIKKIQPLQNKALIEYLDSRKLFFSLAKDFLEEIYYSVDTGEKKHNFFALSFKNRVGGYDVRNAYSKNCIGTKDITIIKGIDSSKVSVFEGSLSFISMLQILKISKMKGDVIVLNTVSMKEDAVDYINENNYKEGYLFLDNDKAGEDCTQYIFNHTHKIFKDARNLFSGFKDPNDLLTNTPLQPTK
jgi:hypothetical protein